MPAPTLYGQFNNLDDTDYVLTALKKLGFDDVFEVSKGAEIVSEATRAELSHSGRKKPVISSACPAVVRLIRVRFPNLIENVLDFNPPMARRRLRERACGKTDGIFKIRYRNIFHNAVYGENHSHKTAYMQQRLQCGRRVRHKGYLSVTFA